MTNITLFDSIEKTLSKLDELEKEFPVQYGVFSILFAKKFTEARKRNERKMVDYWQTNKELPFGFVVEERRSPRKYHFEEDAEWIKANAALEAIEVKLKKASDAKIDGNSLVDETTGEIFPTVSVDFAGVVYSFKKK